MMLKTFQVSNWRLIQKNNFTRLDSLLDFLELSQELRQKILVDPSFALNLPMRLAQKIEKGTLNDPILRQFVPLKEELKTTPGFFEDPVDDKSFRSETRLLKKYKARALLLTTSACAMHCRYCFRKNFDYQAPSDFSNELRIIEEDSSLNEVILSGGDPLSLSDASLSYLLDQLENVSHITKIRFHTRFPIGIPERLDATFLKLLEARRYKIYFVFHINHSKELDEDILTAIQRLQKLGVITLNQSVLLKGVNDHFKVQLELCEKLIDQGILPYYLHQLDRVQGSAHFESSSEKGRDLIEYLRSNLPGYGVPRYVQEIPHKPSKTPL